MKDNSLEWYLYEKSVSCIPWSSKIWRLYFEFLDSLALPKKSLLIDTLNNNRKILSRVHPQSLGFTTPLLYSPSLKSDLEELYGTIIQDLKSSSKYQRPSYFWLFPVLLFVLDQANSQSEFMTFAQRKNLLKTNNSESGSIELEGKQSKRSTKY